MVSFWPFVRTLALNLACNICSHKRILLGTSALETLKFLSSLYCYHQIILFLLTLNLLKGKMFIPKLREHCNLSLPLPWRRITLFHDIMLLFTPLHKTKIIALSVVQILQKNWKLTEKWGILLSQWNFKWNLLLNLFFSLGQKLIGL